ncbi:uncharacterized protein (TIGR03089 family) [Halopolyspora algeriensis]|uniref:Uncharacterized protein (TIGR03089 family) n=1 Tax=Halopolyspora algeriensis TaxID=1500506 RepID=A0A368VDC0_9ACTN|nr:TIGR03089 family protein [Halopolyspora algeriensis]RCW39189.1 uncharacterized protein (TIGR03089 family) [Halopolyspora algeriensis]TQM47443.1 uncharacterized protein (TIGR03089 family) [Halopolyspora algeriensis]
MSVTRALLTPLLTTGSPKPLITHYDEATGARIELSRATVANWAAKTANWLVDELDVEPGTPVAVSLPAHWQTAGILLGAWWCGAHVTEDSAGAEAAFVPASAPGTGEGARTVAAVGLDPLGASATNLPDGVVDYASEVRVHGDDFTPLAPIPGSTPALKLSAVDEVVAAARQRAAELGIDKNARVLSTLEWDLPEGVIDGLLAVLAAEGSLVQITNPDAGTLDKRRSDERTTVELGTGG